MTDYDESTKDAILEVLASAAGLTTEGATLDVDAGSVILTATFPVQSASDVNAASISISSALSDRASLQTAMEDKGVSIVVTTAATANVLYGPPLWYAPSDGVPLSGEETSAACAAAGQRLCRYDELCSSPGSLGRPLDMPARHSSYMPFDDALFGGRRWISSDCDIHEQKQDESGSSETGICSVECCGHGWCTTSGVDNCPGAERVPANGYTESCKGTYACCLTSGEGPSPPPLSPPPSPLQRLEGEVSNLKVGGGDGVPVEVVTFAAVAGFCALLF